MTNQGRNFDWPTSESSDSSGGQGLRSRSDLSGIEEGEARDTKAVNDEKRVIEMIQKSEEYRKLKSAFEKAFNMPLVLCHRDEKRPVMDSQVEKRNPFCAYLFSRDETCQACLAHQHRVHGACRDSGAPARKVCPHGMVDSAVPVALNGNIIGFLRTGQVFDNKPEKNDFSDSMELLTDDCGELPVEMLHEYYFRTRVMSKDEMDGVIELLQMHAENLSKLAQNMELAHDSLEPGIIKKTKAYIQGNLDQPLSLEGVSKEVHCNSFYLCKLFKKVTGTSFTEYINHLRLGKAKKLLMNQDMRISEVALEAGFQSITHFNRVFRKYLGCSPSSFRRDHEAIRLLHQN